MIYSSSVSMNRQRFAARQQNAVSFRTPKRAIGPVSNTIILVILACVLGLIYLTQVTKTNAYGYRINELQKEHTQLKVEHGELEVSAARLQAQDRVKNSEVAQQLVSVAPASTVQR